MRQMSGLTGSGDFSNEVMDRFTAEQVREYNDAFAMFDVDGSGDILAIELRKMLQTIGFNPTDYTLERMILKIDEVFEVIP